MNTPRLIWRSLWFYRRTNLGTLLGAALASVILTGALGVGDAVRHSLISLTESRLGRTAFVVVTQDRFFRADLADRLAEHFMSPTGLVPVEANVEEGAESVPTQRPSPPAQGRWDRIAPVLILDGVVMSPDDEHRVNAVQVVGVDDRFWALAPTAIAPPPLSPGTCRINRVLSDRLGLSGAPAHLVLRLRKPDGLPSDMTLAAREHDTWSRLLTVSGVQEPDAFGHFTLRTTQRLPPTLFVSQAWLAEQLGIAGRANALLIHGGAGTASAIQDALHAAWQLEDAGLRLAMAADGSVELTSDRVFIPPRVADAALAAFPDARLITTYFLNRIEAGGRTTPHSFASAPGAPRVPADLDDDAVLINDWLAHDLGVASGGNVRMTYYAVDTGGQLEERTATFRVAGILPADDVAALDRGLVPDIPGLSDVANCRDWDPGIPIDLDQIRDQDEAYWNQYGPLPRVYLTRAAADRLWDNRFGVYTALRVEGGLTIPEVRDRLHAHLNARDLGFVPQAIREAGLAASRDAVDFGQLFVGLSFFLIVAAILLTVLLFSMGIAQRMEETGTLLALGYRPAAVRHQLGLEGLALAVIGALAGAIAAQGYHRLLLLGLRTLWYEAVHTTIFLPHIRPQSVLAGIAITSIAASAGMAWILRRHGRYTVRELQQGIAEGDGHSVRASRWSLVTGIGALLAAVIIVVAVPVGQGHAAAGAFFASGSFLLAGLLLLAHRGMTRLLQAPGTGGLTRTRLILRTAALRRGRSLACLALMALGVFLVMAVAANRRGPVRNPTDRNSGTGGWLLWCQTTLPVVHDLNSDGGRAHLGRSDAVLDRAVFTPLRLREGDDASCLNLNRVTRPPLLGIHPVDWDQRNPFTFSRLVEGVDPEHPWQALTADISPDTIPAFADMADIVWGLGLHVGDTLDYIDEQGQPFKVKLMGGLAPSILQGHLVLSEAHLMHRFPSLGGARVLLVDAPQETADRLGRQLTRSLGDRGLVSMPTVQRLAEFSSVENTYLSIFMLLGSLGCLIGSAGLGIVAARNILERRCELALLRAVGYRRRQLQWLLFLEHGSLAIAGIAGGALAAALAVAPALLAPETVIPWRGLLLTLASILTGSLLWIGMAIRMAMRGSLITALRAE